MYEHVSVTINDFSITVFEFPYTERFKLCSWCVLHSIVYIHPWEDDKTHTKTMFPYIQALFRGKEVWDPNSVRADALDDSDGKDSAGRPLRYTHPSSHLSHEKTLVV